jgi:hypothetical protein
MTNQHFSFLAPSLNEPQGAFIYHVVGLGGQQKNFIKVYEWRGELEFDVFIKSK